MLSKKPLFIVIDGCDGSGKDTQARLIAQHYLNSQQKIRIRSHPATDNFWGQHSKAALEQGSGRKAHLKAGFYYSGDIIRSLLKYYRHEEEVIIFVRYLLGISYVPRILIEFTYQFFAFLLPTTEYSYFIDVLPEEAQKRILSRGGKLEMFETKERLQKTRMKMLFIAKRKKWHYINGNKTPSEVWAQIKPTLP